MKRRKKVDGALVWECRDCNAQMYGGPRCAQHNPSPEEREARPEQYRREQYAPSYKRP
jgi:hypothetical protein